MQEQEITTISKIFKVSSEHIIAFYYTSTSFNCFSKTTRICFTGKEVIFKRKEDEVLTKITMKISKRQINPYLKKQQLFKISNFSYLFIILEYLIFHWCRFYQNLTMEKV